VKTATSNFSEICHRYYKYKSTFFKGRKLNFWDRNAPYPKSKEFKISWDEAKEIVLNSYYSFDKRFGDIVKLFFEKSWIHARISNGKTSGAFSHPTVPSCHPCILVNFQGRIRDVMTLAHELGHGVHQYLANKNGLLLADTPLTLAETASVFGEMLVFKSLLKNSKNKNEKIYLLRSKIEDMLNTVFRQIAFFKFERDIHKKRIEGELSEEEMCSIWMKIQKESLGDNVDLGGDYKYFWAYIPHFIHSPFYVYAYAFGDCLVNSLYSKYEDGEKSFNNKYFNLLQSGGSKHYQRHLKKFNLNPKDKDFWQLGMNLIKNFMDELEQLS
jgi:oligoendopeptidase F